ncbi:MAG: site-2 protease family protein [Gemmatimonadota bacterium]
MPPFRRRRPGGAPNLTPRAGRRPLGDPFEALVFYIVFLFSVTFHEAAHAWAARRGGDPTAYRGGQVSLDPLPHIRREPFGMVILPIVTVLISGWPFGFASAPYDPAWAHRHPRRAAWMSLAGPGANLFLLLAAALLIRVGIAAGVFLAPDSIEFSRVTGAVAPGAWTGAGLMLSVLFSMNLVLVLLNLLPFPPLDGSGAIPLLLSPEATERYRSFVQRRGLGWIGILVAWQLFDRIYHPMFLLSVNLLYPHVRYG